MQEPLGWIMLCMILVGWFNKFDLDKRTMIISR